MRSVLFVLAIALSSSPAFAFDSSSLAATYVGMTPLNAPCTASIQLDGGALRLSVKVSGQDDLVYPGLVSVSRMKEEAHKGIDLAEQSDREWAQRNGFAAPALDAFGITHSDGQFHQTELRIYVYQGKFSSLSIDQFTDNVLFSTKSKGAMCGVSL